MDTERFEIPKLQNYPDILRTYHDRFLDEVVPTIQAMDEVSQRHAVIEVMSYVGSSIWVLLNYKFITQKTDNLEAYNTFIHDRETLAHLDINLVLTLTEKVLKEAISLLPAKKITMNKTN